MPAVCELATLPLKEGVGLDTKLDDSGKTLLEVCKTVTEQTGCQDMYIGFLRERPTDLQVFVNWDRLEDHQRFMDDPIYQPFVDSLGAVMSGSLFMSHAALRPWPPSKLVDMTQSPITEILYAFFPSDQSEEDSSSAAEDIQTLCELIPTIQGCRGGSGGWSIEKDLPLPAGKEGKGKAWVHLIGWDSYEAHMAARETETFKRNIHLLRDAKGLIATSVVHYSGTKV